MNEVNSLTTSAVFNSSAQTYKITCTSLNADVRCVTVVKVVVVAILQCLGFGEYPIAVEELKHNYASPATVNSLSFFGTSEKDETNDNQSRKNSHENLRQ